MIFLKPTLSLTGKKEKGGSTMKKIIIMVVLALLIVFTAVPVMAGNEMILKDGGYCKGTNDIKIDFRMSMPGGFPTWGDVKNRQSSGHNPWLIQYNQIHELYVEIIYEGGFFNIIYLQRGRDWYYRDGHLVVKVSLCMPSGTVLQLLAKGSFGDYQLAIDNPSIPNGIDDIYGFGRGCGFHQLRDGTWGISCKK